PLPVRRRLAGGTDPVGVWIPPGLCHRRLALPPHRVGHPAALAHESVDELGSVRADTDDVRDGGRHVAAQTAGRRSGGNLLTGERAMAGDAVVHIDHLNHSYGAGALERQVLFDVCADIQRGEIVILTGPSGGGKTTLLTLIGALRSVQDGSLAV